MPLLLTTTDLKELLHRDLSRLDKLLVVLASLDAPCQVRQIRDRANDAGYRIPAKWNLSNCLGSSRGKAIRTPMGWEITDTGRHHLHELGISRAGPATKVAMDLRDILSNIVEPNTRSFVEEAIGCYEAELYRSAIVMSWIGAVSVLHTHVHALHLQEFNQEARRRNRKWRLAKTTDDLSRMRESDFLDIVETLSVIGGNVKRELKSCLDLRNGCGHPNSLQVGANAAAHHLELLLLNVFTRIH